jgi:hypothetical protein
LDATENGKSKSNIFHDEKICIFNDTKMSIWLSIQTLVCYFDDVVQVIGTDLFADE